MTESVGHAASSVSATGPRCHICRKTWIRSWNLQPPQSPDKSLAPHRHCIHLTVKRRVIFTIYKSNYISGNFVVLCRTSLIGLTLISISDVAQGVGHGVPKYLQYSGSVRNRHLSKRDCALLIRDIWHEKGRHDAQVCVQLLCIS